MPELSSVPCCGYLGETEATVWVETDASCEVEILGHSRATFEVYGHHYAIVAIQDLEPGTTYEYEVALDGETKWPEPDSDLPPSRIRTFDPDGPFDISFGSCRVAVPHEPAVQAHQERASGGKEVDALRVLALRDVWQPRGALAPPAPHARRPGVRGRGRARDARVHPLATGTSEPPGEEVADFEEYTRLYWESWREPMARWLFSTVSTSMTFDDHDVRDDWNISAPGSRRCRRSHGGTSESSAPTCRTGSTSTSGTCRRTSSSENQTYQRVREADGDAGDIVREYAVNAAEHRDGSRWSFHRDLGRNRVIVMDSRAGRVLREGHRSIIDEPEWEWIRDQAHGDFDNLIIGTSDPYILSHGMHYAEAWSERVCDGAWGGLAAKLGERIRRAVDLDHWAAFHVSFHRLARLLREVGTGELGKAPGVDRGRLR